MKKIHENKKYISNFMGVKYNILSSNSAIAFDSLTSLFTKNFKKEEKINNIGLEFGFGSGIHNENQKQNENNFNDKNKKIDFKISNFIDEKNLEVLREKIYKYEKELEIYAEIQSQKNVYEGYY